MVYADYPYYCKIYRGKDLSFEEFERLAVRASTYIDSITGGRVKDPPPEPVKLAVCSVAEAWNINEQGGDVVSESVGSWSKTFASGLKPKTPEARLYDAAALYLSNTGLLTRWV